MKKTNNPGILFNHLEGALGKRNAAAHWELQIFDLYKEVQFKIKSSAVAERTIYQKHAQQQYLANIVCVLCSLRHIRDRDSRA